MGRQLAAGAIVVQTTGEVLDSARDYARRQVAAFAWRLPKPLLHEVPQSTPEQAVHRLDATELPFRFFRDAFTDRGAVLYRRYDGRYGLITPAQPREQHDGH